MCGVCQVWVVEQEHVRQKRRSACSCEVLELAKDSVFETFQSTLGLE